MKEFTISPQGFKILLKNLRIWQEVFTLTTTGNTSRVQSRKGNYVCRTSVIPTKDLHIIGKVCKHVAREELQYDFMDYWPISESHGIWETRYPTASIPYFGFSEDLEEEVLHDYVEIDYNSAYWDLALKMGIITKEIYDLKDKVGKKGRLAALGALATQKTVEIFNGKTYELQPDECMRRETHACFFAICHEFGYDYMLPIFEEMNAKMFWVDALIVKKSQERETIDMIRSLGMTCKTIDLEWIDATGRKVRVMEKGAKNPKVFYRQNLGRNVRGENQEVNDWQAEAEYILKKDLNERTMKVLG